MIEAVLLCDRGCALDIILNREDMRGRNICSGEVLTAVSIIDGTNVFVRNAPPIFTHHL